MWTQVLHLEYVVIDCDAEYETITDDLVHNFSWVMVAVWNSLTAVAGVHYNFQHFKNSMWFDLSFFRPERKNIVSPAVSKRPQGLLPLFFVFSHAVLKTNSPLSEAKYAFFYAQEILCCSCKHTFELSAYFSSLPLGGAKYLNPK